MIRIINRVVDEEWAEGVIIGSIEISNRLVHHITRHEVNGFDINMSGMRRSLISVLKG